MNRTDTRAQLRVLKLRLALVFAAVSLVIIAGGFFYYRHYRASLLTDAGSLLGSIERFKIDQLETWRAERLEDTVSLLDSPILSVYLNRLADNVSDTGMKTALKGRLQNYLKHNRYRAAFLTDSTGKVIISAGSGPAICDEAKKLIRQSAVSAKPVLGDFHLTSAESRPHLDLVAKAAAGKTGKALFLVLRIEPDDYLYPLIQSWPTNSRSGETLLIRKDGNDILYLNRLRHRQSPPLSLRIPADSAYLPAARALSGENGIFEGTDYRGKKVLAYISMVPETDWGFVAKMDLDEVMADSTTVSILLTLLTLVLLAAAGGLTRRLFRQQRDDYMAVLKAADAELAQSEDKFRLFFENSPLGESITGLDGSLKANSAFCALLGYSEQELRGKKWQELTPAEEIERIEVLLKPLLTGERTSVQFEKHYIRKDGSLVPAEVTTAVQRGAAGRPEYLITSVNDITARKLAEEKLRESELALKEAQQLTKVGSWEFDPATGEGAWTDEVARIHDLEPGQPTNMALGTSFYLPESRAKIEAAIKKAIEEGKPYALDLEMTTAKGAHKWVHTIGQATVQNGRTVKVRGTFQDITDIKLAEEALRASESAVRNKLKAIMEPDGDLGKLELSDIFDIPSLQGMMDELYKLTNITSAILDINGKVLVASGWQDICTKFHRVNPETCRHCLESDTLLTNDIATGASKSYFCKNNMRDIATPLLVGGRHVGNFFLGQFLYDDDPHNLDTFREQALRYGFDEKEYLAAYARIPVFSREKVKSLITFYRHITELVSTLSYGKIKLARALAQSQRTEEMLRESQEIFSTFMEHSPIYVFFKDENIRPLRLSRNYETMLGRPVAELLGKNMNELFPSELARNIVADDLRILKDGKEVDTIEELNGRIYRTIKFPISITGRPRYLAGYTIDITAQKQTEAALLASEQRYKNLFEKNSSVMLLINPGSGSIVDANPAACAFYGWSREELREKTIQQINTLPPEGVEAEMLKAVAEKRGHFLFNHRRADGALRDVEVYSSPIPAKDGPLLLSIIQDITERKLAEDALQKSEQRLRSLWTHMAEGVALHELVNDASGLPADYRIIETNPQYANILGIRAEDVTGKLASQAYGTVAPPYLPEYAAVVKSGVPGHLEIYFAPLGKYFSISIAPWGTHGFATIFSDVTARKQAELDLEKVNQDLLEKKQEMENFLYITTHDLRSPLVNIQGFSQNLEHYMQELKKNIAPAGLPPGTKDALEQLTGERIPTALKFILESSHKMDALITALLKVSRIGRVEMKPETLEMNGLVDKVGESLHYQLEQAGGQVKRGDLPSCKADPGAVSQLFTNLLDNAIKYRQEGRALTVNITGETRDGMAFYDVADNGSGIQESDLGRIWDIFYRHGTLPGKGGEGIGLPMVKRIAQKNGGNITVKSQPGEGSVFCVSLPAAEAN